MMIDHIRQKGGCHVGTVLQLVILVAVASLIGYSAHDENNWKDDD